MTDRVDKHVVALVLDEIGTLLDLLGENRFRAGAFHTAARELDRIEGDVEAMVRSGELAKTRGFGPATVAVARELVETGDAAFHRDLRERTPSGLVDMLRIPGLGARRIHALHVALGVDSLADLEAAARDGRIAELRGFGEKTQRAILEGLGHIGASAGRRRQNAAYQAAARLIGTLETVEAVLDVRLAGELRRRLETVDGVDALAIVADDDDGADREAAVAAFLALPGVAGAERAAPAAGATLAARARLADGLELRLHMATPAARVAAWVHATGSAAHVRALGACAAARKLRFAPDGLWQGRRRIELEDEPALYEALGLAFVPPELRESGEEVDAAAADAIPRLIETADLRGTFHCHTTASDGKATLPQMAEAALGRGWRYLGIADHSQAAAYAGGLSVPEIRRQHRAIDAWNEARGDELWLFKGIEADILADGRVDYAEQEGVLESFDYVVASVHSSLRQDQATMTRRVIRALENPHVTILGHATGRRLLEREASELDVDAVMDAAADLGKVVEINGDPRRLDLDWRYWRRARDLGVRCAIDPDAHSTAGLGNVELGIGMARKGWLRTGDVVNAWPFERVREHFGMGD